MTTKQKQEVINLLNNNKTIDEIHKLTHIPIDEIKMVKTEYVQKKVFINGGLQCALCQYWNYQNSLCYVNYTKTSPTNTCYRFLEK